MACESHPGHSMQEQIFHVTGMSCTACAGRVEQAAKKVPGVKEAEVNLITGELRVKRESGDPQEIVRAVIAYGYGAEEKVAAAPPARDVGRTGKRGWVVLATLALLLPLIVLHHLNHATGWAEVCCALSIAVLNYGYFTRGVRSLLDGALGMDTLVATGSGVALASGLWHVYNETGGAMFLESSGMILAFVSVGKWLEARATRRTGKAVDKLRGLLPETATVLRNGQPVQIPTAELSVGDILSVRPGDRIAADGAVVQGNSAVNEAALTGESMPVDKQEGAGVFAGTVNLHGAMLVRVLQPQEQSTLSGVIRLVSDAAAKKAPVARLADRVARIFVPVVVAVACVTAAVWLGCGATRDEAAARAVAVLVISCPCALGLATPVAIMVGAGMGAERGILFRSGVALEAAGRATCVALDKTGTLTVGAPQLTDVLPHSCSREELLGVAVALEIGANHPLARAVIACGVPPAGQVSDLCYLPGHGVRACLEGEACAIGNAALMREMGVDVQDPEELLAQGKTVLHVVRAGLWLGSLAVSDAPRENAVDAVRALRQAGLRTLMITGDNAATARSIAERVGVAEVHASALPGDKERFVRELQTQGECVAMVGDGVNDAPALTRADVGIAIGTGTDIAVESAGIILMHSDPTDIPHAILLCRAILKKIRQNLFWAFIYNVLAIPLAAGAYYPLFGWQLHPAIAAAAMGLSSLSVVLNALSLRNTHFAV